ncbi:MAG TPA: hypothetical protein V6C78_12485 [Crinalium sp.]
MKTHQHPLQSGQIVSSPGGHFTYQIIGPCCRLFDREELPWPCCRLEWRGKEPSWRRVGKRFVVDLSSRNSPSYSVQILEHHHSSEPIVITMYWVKLPQWLKDWWHSRHSSRYSLDSTAQAEPVSTGVQ